MEDNVKRSSSTVAFMLGALAGGVAALLLARESGSELRGRIRRQAGDLKEKGERLAHKGQESMDTLVGAASEVKSAYKTEFDRQRDSRAGASPDGKRYAETEMGASKSRPGSQT